MQEEYKRCRHCSTDKPLSAFSKGTARCKPCHNAWYRAYRQTPHGRITNKAIADARYRDGRALLQQLKDKPCADCGVQYHPAIMQFDHRDPSQKKHLLSKLASSNRVEAMISEAQKCDVVCANCHIIRTVRQLESGAFKTGRPPKSVSPVEMVRTKCDCGRQRHSPAWGCAASA